MLSLALIVIEKDLLNKLNRNGPFYNKVIDHFLAKQQRMDNLQIGLMDW